MISLFSAGGRVGAQVVYTDSLPQLEGNWVQQLCAAKFNVNDPRIRYPKFPNFIRKIYNWGDLVFNSYDPNYVIGTGKNWKASLKSYDWMQSYVYDFAMLKDNRVALRTGVYSDLGLSVNFMGISLGYTWNVNKWFRGENDKRDSFDFSFTTALFSAELRTSSNSTHGRLSRDGVESAEFERWRKIHTIPVSQKSLNFNAYYFFNHRQYSQAAAYSFSKYQLRSAGSWLLGIDYNRQSIDINFSVMPADLLAEIPGLPLSAHYNYIDYNLICGYAYNFVLPKHWLINLTVLPSVGYKRMPYQQHQTTLETISLGSIGKTSFTYSHDTFFASVQLNVDGNFVLTSKYAFFNSTEALTAVVGVRF